MTANPVTGAENVKITIGNASPDKKIEKIEIKGTDAITGLPRKLEMDSVEVREALESASLLVHGSADVVVPISQSTAFQARLRDPANAAFAAALRTVEGP